MAEIELMKAGCIEMAIVDMAIVDLALSAMDDIQDSDIDSTEVELEAEADTSDIVLGEADRCFGLGLNHSAGAGMPVNLIEAHKWFNIAAMRGHSDAARLRREVAEQMSDSEIGTAQRAARDWLKANPQAPAAEPVRIAA